MKKLLLSIAALFCAQVQGAWADFGNVDAITLRAATDARSLQYRVMRMTADFVNPGGFNIASNNLGSSAVGLAAGILQTNPDSGQAGSIAYNGISKGVAGAALTTNGPVTHDGSGYVIDAVSGSIVIGRALTAAAAAGEVTTVLLQSPVRWGAVT